MNHHSYARIPLASALDHASEDHNAVESSQAYRKRKRESLDMSRVSDWFEAKVISRNNAQTEAIVSFSPVKTVLRAHVPLAWLANDSSSMTLRNGAVLRADVTSMTRWDYSILIARQVPNGALYAIERLELDTYVCFPLRDFVTVDMARQAAFGAAPPVDLESILRCDTQQHHQRTASISSNASTRGQRDGICSPKQPKNRRGMLARQVILAKPIQLTEVQDATIGIDEDNSPLIETSGGSEVVDERVEHIQEPLNILDHCKASEKEENESQVFETLRATKEAEDKELYVDQLSPEYLRKRYLEMLYLSKTSLAFYAKGPLSRTRARARVHDASKTLYTLGLFYEDSLVPVKKLDLKYKTSLPTKIATMTIDQLNEDDVGTRQNQPSKTSEVKKSRRTKLGKDALWPMEHDFIQKWWHNRESGGKMVNTAEALAGEVQRRLAPLRMREIQLQVILILEILALKSQQQADIAGPSNGQNDVNHENPNNESLTPISKPPSTNKTRNLRADLEVLLDRICILHSVGFDELGAASRDHSTERQTSGEAARDDLKDFCKDVVVPFYSSKLPDICKTVCKKLGDLEMSPQRPKLSGAGSGPQRSPGTAITGIERAANKRALSRVLSQEHGLRNGSPPTLVRSSTLPVSANPKREPSERPKSRGGVQKSLSFTNREIDLVADAEATATKRRKLDRIVAQKRELEAAIDALKKPNRLITAKSFMDDVEGRITDGRLPNKKNDPVQITATPKISRVKPVLVEEYDLPPITTVASMPEDTLVPSSTIKPRGLGHFSTMGRSSAKKKAVLSAIHNTPLRGQGHNSHWLKTETSSGLHQKREMSNQSSCTLVNSTPSTSRLRVDLFDAVFSTPTQPMKQQDPLLTTQVKRAPLAVEAVFKDIPEISEMANQMMDRVMKMPNADVEVSIYDSLGWTNDDDDDI